MSDLKDLLKTKNFVINGLIIKNINKLNISLNEFLLILYFINIDNRLDMLSIKKYLGLKDEEIINIYSELMKKGLIEMVINKDGKIIEESVSLEPFYNKLILKDEKEVTTDIYSKFESEFGRTLSPIEYETINNWINNNISEDLILKALKEAVLNGVSNLRYIDKILCEWTKKGIKNASNNERKEELFDYDWLNENE